MSRGLRPLDEAQRRDWDAAQDLWGVSVHDPILTSGSHEGAFAWFTFPPQVTVDLGEIRRSGVGRFLESVFAHEIGHHVLSPSTRITSLKIVHQMARAIQATDPSATGNPANTAHTLSNLWSDMLINVRVAEQQRRRIVITSNAGAINGVDGGSGQASPQEPQMIRLWRVLSAASVPGPMWWVIYRGYEILWGLPPGTLCPADPPAVAQDPLVGSVGSVGSEGSEGSAQGRTRGPVVARGNEATKAAIARAVEEAQHEFDGLGASNPMLDASLLAETVKTFGQDPVSGALRFGMIFAPYLSQPRRTQRRGHVYCGGEVDVAPATAAEMVAVLGDGRLTEAPEHPAITKARLAALGAAGQPVAVEVQPAGSIPQAGGGLGQGYGLAATIALYSASDANDVIAAWYQTQARRWIRPMQQVAPTATGAEDEIPGPLGDWDLGDDLTDIDWSASLARSAVVIPGVTTSRRDSLDDPPPTRRTSIDLDLYIDSSGSMRSPLAESPAVLAGTILILSVLRGGGRVRVTSFSGTGQVAGGDGFTRKAVEALRLLTTYFGGGTTFPLDLYGDRYRSASTGATVIRRHVVVLSDEGLASMFGQGQDQFAHVAARVRRLLDTGTLILQDRGHSIAGPAAAAGYTVEYINTMADAPAACAELAERLLRQHTSTGVRRYRG
ncbi:MAG: hypothetical protein JWQ43_693 [Glaciihabitans sp.]|nr:hypothetical protein [Glaciihabitans sp.]